MGVQRVELEAQGKCTRALMKMTRRECQSDTPHNLIVVDSLELREA
jgi:hypothetical protein